MGNINVLTFAVANLIAAGEVVDRPASVIKELLENAIDSGATRITVEIQNGGVTFMRVTDNGCGMPPEDLEVAVMRHATSKIREAEDLDHIMTLGFRGEALAAIAAVSYMRIISKTRDSQYGAMLEVQGGNVLSLTERGSADGTTVIVEDLFANVPARRKFLRRDMTEASAVATAVEKIALSRPDIAIKFFSDNTLKFETMGDGDLHHTIHALWGRDVASRMIGIRGAVEGIEVTGFISRPDAARSTRNYQNLFINGRFIKNKIITAALEQAYSSYIPTEKFPCCVLNLTINPAAVDVNVHPAKLEVKFSNDKPIFEAIYYAVRAALEENTTRPSVTFAPQAAPVNNPFVPIRDGREESLKTRQLSYVEEEREPPARPSPTPPPVVPEKAEGAEKVEPVSEGRAFVKSYLDTFLAKNGLDAIPKEEPAVPEPPTPVPPTSTPSPVAPEPDADAPVATPFYRILGEAFHAYVIVELEGKLLLIDKHAAHERILFEAFKKNMRSREVLSQHLMLPVEVTLTSDELQAVREFKDKIEAVGFELEPRTYSVSVSAVPVGISLDAVADVITTMADRMKNSTGSVELTRDIVFEKALYQASCKAAIKAGREYPQEDIEWLVARLMEIPDITYCPHGRPVAIQLSKKNLDKQFERT